MVIKGLLQKGSNSDKEFLDKIVQMPINLPKIPSENIGNYLVNNISELLQELNIPSEKKKNFQDSFLPDYRVYYSKFFRTLRSAKRYVNGNRATLPLIKGEVKFTGLFLCLKLYGNFFPSVYDEYMDNRKILH